MGAVRDSNIVIFVCLFVCLSGVRVILQNSPESTAEQRCKHGGLVLHGDALWILGACWIVGVAPLVHGIAAKQGAAGQRLPSPS